MAKRPQTRTHRPERKAGKTVNRPQARPAAAAVRRLAAPSRPATLPAPPAAPPAAPLPAGPSPLAVRQFEVAVRALQRHEYSPAADGFRRLLSEFPAERALLDRAQVYLDLCERELRRRPTAPETIEERLTAATAALNNGDDDEAESLAHGVLNDSPEHDLALYLLAAVYGRRGNRSQALDLLRRAMQVSPDIRAQARHDADFEILREMQEFQDLLDMPASSSGSNGRRLRCGRPER